MYKLIYLNDAKDTQIDCTTSSCALYSMATDPSNFKLDSTLTPSSTSGTTKFYTALPAGYYAVKLDYTTSEGTLTYQSDTYPCPYDHTQYSDLWKIY